MMEQLKAAYDNNQWVRLATAACLLACGVLLYQLSGGFPPWAWRFTATILPQTSRLWDIQGAAILLPLIGLVLLSTSLLVLWGVILCAVSKILVGWWQDFHSQQRLEQDLREAEQLADQMYARERHENERSQELDAAWDSGFFLADSSQEHTSWQAAVNAQAVPQRASRREVSPAAAAPAYTQKLAAASNIAMRATPSHVPIQPPPERNEQPPSPSTSSLRQQFYIVPRPEEQVEEEHVEAKTDQNDYDTLPSFPILPDSWSESAQQEEGEQQETFLRLAIGIGLDPGIVRKNAPNEDNLFAVQGMRMGKHGPEPAGLFVVADGMGGHANGREASHLAIQTISDVVTPVILRNNSDDETFIELLKDGVHRANLAIYRRNRQKEDPENNMMGTTITAALVVGTTAYIVNVGDSRTYLYRPSEGLKQITRDHSVVARMVEAGSISQEEVYTHPKRNLIYRCLGEHSTIELDSFQTPLQAGDILLLCSDGLWEMVRDVDIEHVIASSAPHAAQISSMLVQAALSRGGADNISVIAACVLRSDGQPSA